MTGKQILSSVIAIVLATAVLPPAAAWTVNRRRVARAEREVSMIARELQAREHELQRVAAEADVLCGPGRFPATGAAEVQPWMSGPRASLGAVLPGARLSPDPWGNCIAVNLTGRDGAAAPVWVLSAGPNGTIETAYGANALEGDDIGARLR